MVLLGFVAEGGGACTKQNIPVWKWHAVRHSFIDRFRAQLQIWWVNIAMWVSVFLLVFTCSASVLL